MQDLGHTDKYVMVAKETKEELSGKMVSGIVKGFLQSDILEI